MTLPKFLIDYSHKIGESESRAHYMTPIFQAQCYAWLARLVRAKRVLEVGVYLGFSSMVWSFAVGTDGIVTGLEYDPKYVQPAGQAFEEYGVKNCEIVLGDAAKT